MDFTLSLEQQALRESVDRFIQRDYGWEQRQAVIRSPDGISPGHWAMFAELGWLGAGLHEEAGGFGGGASENAVLMEAFGRGLVVEPLVPHIIASHVLAGSEGEAAAQLLAQMVMGERRVVVAHNEGRREDLLGVDTRIEGGLLSGRKTLVEGASVADLLIVSARGEDGGLQLCLVDPWGAGVTVQSYRTLDNHRVADIAFAGVRIDDAARLSFRDTASETLERALDQGVVALCAEAVGAMEAALMLTRDYLLTRRQFGAPLGTFQALQHRMADMLIETEMARSILFNGLGGVDAQDADIRRHAVSAAKAQIGAAGAMMGANAIQLHGGIGMTEEYAVGHYYKRLFVIARSLGDAGLHTARFSAASDRLADRAATEG